ncbi:MAG TPA: bifunctional diaminohydroxyphosphoribosylaminopyrimidine deaminase/5-amino-6-(5-phosphoribosylamino)uracil reductase RibD [Pseudolabrys sp.]|uniref:bifunctional diaminohydroxyphosphoribosylaminopyrimidine deaminase/5-amino-6-(5-phosphoribosylamino)uracil reductase RibD n=1 Tax=Pseudolabrys sp. TaxID=1960880 RepID=UPI002DDDA08D|nr:bifunctional diaminohydroxyphosphoribosylaminopyrimidine deaminase/5-amino-6-(5-phosphoribosylamino)uracil reductase RibD [Pseudolabrys sp.]HEV2628550.1 bifunctional diaminohydroxyphosphoribosylaminopyrimidine deaminase/5-amino-6-(5-phosphoribosylamino)uracil reductase RibD [Pseudolabrys sp.]
MTDTDFTAEDLRFMRLALDLGRRGLGHTAPNPAVGAVIVKDGVIVGRGWTQDGGRPHAEVEALKRAKRAANGATLYVTLEPCSHQGQTPPCADAVIKAGIARVVSAMEDPNPEVAGQGHARLREKKITVDVGLLGEEARRAHAGHIARVTQHRPRVLLKLAVSADGKAGLAHRKTVQITGEEARERVFMLRAQNDAILVGIGTVLADNPQLTSRLPGMMERSPVRVVLDAQLRTPLSLSVISTVRDCPTWLFCGEKASEVAQDILEQKGVRVFRVPETDGRLDLDAVLKTLNGEGITRLMVEGGPTVAASFVAAGLVDEVALLRGLTQIGANGIDALEGLPLGKLTEGMTPLGSETLGVDTLEWYGRT